MQRFAKMALRKIKVEGLTLSVSKTEYKATVIKTMVVH